MKWSSWSVPVCILEFTIPVYFNVYIVVTLYTQEMGMRTNIVIDDKLMAAALKLAGIKSKREAVELGLKTLISLRKQENIKRFKGKLKWDGNLNAMRTNR